MNDECRAESVRQRARDDVPRPALDARPPRACDGAAPSSSSLRTLRGPTPLTGLGRGEAWHRFGEAWLHPSAIFLRLF